MESLRKAFDVLEVFLAQGGELGLSDIANITKLNISTVHGIMAFLRKREYVIQKGKRGKYSLGYKFLEFSDAISKSLPMGEMASPYMKELNGLTHETITLAVLNEYTALIIDRVESPHGLRVSGKAEHEAPLYCTGVGKVLLAYQSEESWREYFSQTDLVPSTSNTIMDFDRLREHLLEIRQQGYGIDNQEFELGVVNIAAPIRDRNGKAVAAVGILGPTVRITDAKIGELVIAVKGCASEISRAIGYRDIP
jgi:DNA-binding IclR family transcriptional regulator